MVLLVTVHRFALCTAEISSICSGMSSVARSFFSSHNIPLDSIIVSTTRNKNKEKSLTSPLFGLNPFQLRLVTMHTSPFGPFAHPLSPTHAGAHACTPDQRGYVLLSNLRIYVTQTFLWSSGGWAGVGGWQSVHMVPHGGGLVCASSNSLRGHLGGSWAETQPPEEDALCPGTSAEKEEVKEKSSENSKNNYDGVKVTRQARDQIWATFYAWTSQLWDTPKLPLYTDYVILWPHSYTVQHVLRIIYGTLSVRD